MSVVDSNAANSINLVLTGAFLGKGSYSKVVAGKLGNLDVAVKTTVTMSKTREKHAVNEIDVLKKFEHENIVRLYANIISMTPEGLSVTLALELCDGVFGGQMTLVKCKRVCRDILRALCYLHAAGYVHRDVKPQNILLKNDKAVLSDFGFCAYSDNNGVDHFCGTPYYMSPEGLNKSKSFFKSDIWSLGISLIEVLTGKHPFASAVNIDHMAKLSLEQINFEIPFIKSMIEIDLGKRKDAKDLLGNEWLFEADAMDFFTGDLSSSFCASGTIPKDDRIIPAKTNNKIVGEKFAEFLKL